MRQRQAYTGIDIFRWAAAFLIVAIHTSPLASFSETGDFILTRVIARVAVPFFLMTSGFFLLGGKPSGDRQTCARRTGEEKLWRLLKKTAVIYGAAILLYLPLNIYNGYFSGGHLPGKILKDLLFDGTMYHLWYLPAAMLGAVIAWYARKRMGYPGALLLTAALYIIGCFGDSYYGLAERIPWLREGYGQLFQVSDYTRNGIFYAPVFLILGGMLSDRGRTLAKRQSLAAFLVSFGLMLAEALTLRQFHLQRHDSMYLFLLPAAFFLFGWLLTFRGRRIVFLRDSAMLIYLLHPMMIVVVRMAARLTGLWTLLVENSLVHYLAVCISTLLVSLLLLRFWDGGKKRFRTLFSGKSPGKGGKGEKDHKGGPQGNRQGRAWLEISRENLRHNVEELKKIMPEGCRLMAVVKAEAYGHGGVETAALLAEMGVDAFATATLEEAIEIRKSGVRGEILILGYTDPKRAWELHRYRLTQTAISYRYARKLDAQGVPVDVHLKIDTGMHRLGIESRKTEEIADVFSMGNLRVSGMYTHLCCADSRDPKDIAFTRRQIADFYGVVEHLRETGIEVPRLHIQSSYGLLNYPELRCDYVRIGIALYGVLSSPGDQTVVKADLRPALALKTRVVLIRQVPKGETVGYGRTFIAERDSRIAILPVGYADGYPRSLSGGGGSVRIHGTCFPVAGRICMDQLAVDITGAEDIREGDIATLIGCEELSGKKGADERERTLREPSAEESKTATPQVAANSGSISNELLSRMGMRLPRVVV